MTATGNTGGTFELPEGVRIRHVFAPGDIGALTSLHGVLYAREYGWDHTFEAYVAGPLSAFSMSASNRERIWIVERGGNVAGSIAIVQAEAETAQLRWFLLHPDLRGTGLGRHLVQEAVEFCTRRGYRSVYLWTEARLAAAAHLYVTAGFALTEEKTHTLWGSRVTEQRYDLKLS